MAQQTINIGTSANDGTGDSLRDGGDKINDNFTELYTDLAAAESDIADKLDSVVGGTNITIDNTDPQNPIISASGSAAGDVTAGANLGDNLLIRGDGALKGVQNTGISIDDSDNVTNAGIDADNNTITNIANDEIKAGAAIDASKIADGSVSNTEFEYLDGVGSQIVGKDDTQTLTNKTLTDSTTFFADNSDATKKMQFQLSGVTTATTRTLTIPDESGTIELVKPKAFYTVSFVAGTSTWDVTNGLTAKITMTGNTTISITNVEEGDYGLLKVIQDATGSRLLTLPANSLVIDGGGGAITLTATANAVDILTWVYDGTDFIFNYGLNYT